MNFSGLMRRAAPVGQARTQAGPAGRSLHMSHFTAFFTALGRHHPFFFLALPDLS